MDRDEQLTRAFNSSPLVHLLFVGLGFFVVLKAPRMVETQKSLVPLWFDERYYLWLYRGTGAAMVLIGLLALVGVI